MPDLKEPSGHTQGTPLFVRTKDRVLVRFEGLEAAKRWLASGRISIDEEYLGADNRWHPLSRLFRIEIAGGEEGVGSETPTKVEKRVELGPQQSDDKVGPVERQGTETKASQRWWDVGGYEASDNIWESDPDGERQRRTRRAKKVVAACVVVALGGLLLVLGIFKLRPEEAQQLAEKTPSISVSSLAERDTGPEIKEDTPRFEDVVEEPDWTPSGSEEDIGSGTQSQRTESPVAKKGDQVAGGFDELMKMGSRFLDHSPERAFEYFSAASKIKPNSVEARTKMAECKLRMGRLADAEALFKLALSINPEYGPAIAGLARTYARLGRKEEARYHYMRYLELHPYGSQADEARRFLGR